MADLKTILQKLSINEKLSLLTGANFWETVSFPQFNLPKIVMNDGPFGVRKPRVSEGAGILEDTYPATCFPTTSALASSFNRDILKTMGETLALECKDQGVDLLLGPGLNLKRSPLCGRNFEYFSEDPFVTSSLATSLIDGLQSKGVGATIKHYAANNQENDRFTTNAIVDKRALNELYLKAFHDVIKASSPAALMCSYNQLNGQHASRNYELLTTKLRDEAHFKGLVMSDWGAVVNLKDSVNAGLNLEMPGGQQDIATLEAGLKDGTLTTDQVDRAITPLLELMIKKRDAKPEKIVCNYDDNFNVAIKIGEESAVLLKNEENVLPLRNNTKVALIGNFAKKPRYQGSGSSKINPHKLVSVYDSFVANNVDFVYSDGYREHDIEANETLINEAVKVAKEAEVVVICAGLPESYEVEGYDRPTIDMPPSHNALIAAISRVHKRVVVVLSIGSPVLMPWVNDVQTILLAHLLGGATGPVTYNLLFGHANPSGKLSETYPLNLEDRVPGLDFLKPESNVLYRESLYIGYRYYDTYKKQVLFPFGHGLSYTQFHTKVNDLVIKDDGFEISITVANIGHLAGSEVVGIYIGRSFSKLYGPKKELKAFTKVFLAPGEKQDITLFVSRDSLRVYHPLLNKWVLENTFYNVYVGINVLEAENAFDFIIEDEDDLVDLDEYRSANEKYYDTKTLNVTSQDFETLYGEKLPLYFPNRKRPFTFENSISDTTDYFIGRKIYNIMVKTAVKMAGDDVTMIEMAKESIKKMPFRSITALSSGAITYAQSAGLIDMLNGRLIRGAIKYLKKPKQVPPGK